MKLIAHRGNINGPNSKKENSPEYIKLALLNNYEVEIDLRVINKKLYLGHDSGDHLIAPKFLYKKGLWIHAKNEEALCWLQGRDKNLNYFWHQEDKFTLTSKLNVWAYPSKQIFRQAINVMPEINNLTRNDLKNVKGICSDFIERYK